MEMSSQRHAPAALHPGKESLVPIVQKFWLKNLRGRDYSEYLGVDGKIY